MAYTINKNNPSKFLPKLVAISPYELYLNQVKSTIESIRFAARGMEYLPPQMGGIFGQRKVLEEKVILQVIDFEVE